MDYCGNCSIGGRNYSMSIPTATYSFNFNSMQYSMDFETRPIGYVSSPGDYLAAGAATVPKKEEEAISPSRIEIISPEGKREKLHIENLVDRFIRKEPENEIEQAMDRQRD